MKDRLPDWIFWPLATLGLLAVRLPYLLSPNRILDGDEAIVGLMAKHLAAFSDLSVFFWGQSYGLALIETVPAAVAFKVFGVGSAVLSLSMFWLFMVGLWLYEGGFRNLTGSRWWSRALALGLGLFPVWIVWSFKARSGYLSAFLLGGLLLRLVTARELGVWRAGLAGAGLGVLLFAQPLWLVAILPLCLIPFLREAGFREGMAMVVGAAVMAAPLGYLSSVTPAFWVPDVLGPPSLAPLLKGPETLYRMFTGLFYLGEVQPAPWPVSAVGILSGVGWALSILALGLRFFRKRDWMALILAVSLVGSVAVVPFLKAVQPRYLIQASVTVMIAAAFFLGRAPASFSKGRRIVASAGVLVLAGAAATFFTFKPTHPSATGDLEQGLRTLIEDLQHRQVEGAYSMNPQLQWQILFYGDEEIATRYTSPRDRRPEYPRRVDSALASGKPVALVGTLTEAEGLLQSPLAPLVRPVGKGYFVMTEVSRPLLEILGFEFLPGT